MAAKCIVCGKEAASDPEFKVIPFDEEATAIWKASFGVDPNAGDRDGICKACDSLPPKERRRRIVKAYKRLAAEIQATLRGR